MVSNSYFKLLVNQQSFYYNLNIYEIKMNSQEDPQACTKCGCMPEDILMLACSHDLCLNCASDRLAFEMKKNKNANAIVCQECHQKTPLDTESINVLKNLIKPTVSQVRGGYEPGPAISSSKYPDASTYERPSRNPPADKNTDKYNYQRGNANNSIVDRPGNNSTVDRGLDRGYDRGTDRLNVASNGKSKVGSSEAFQGISSKKTCTQHHEEEILYFCFDCKCECICPECVIHGKHKDHDVKTIRKSQPIVKAEIDKYVESFNLNVETLLIRKSEIEKQIRSLTEQNNMSKRQIQQAFDDLRSKISQQQKQVLSKCDQNLADNLSQLDKSSKQIVKKIDELKSYALTMGEATRKDQILFLNFYSRKHKELQQQAKDPEISIPYTELPSNQSVLSNVLDLSDQASRLGSTPRPARKGN